MEKKVCKDCCHFRQHYIKKDYGPGESCYLPIDDGHCVNPRLKIRSGMTPACKLYKMSPKQKKED